MVSILIFMGLLLCIPSTTTAVQLSDAPAFTPQESGHYIAFADNRGRLHLADLRTLRTRSLSIYPDDVFPITLGGEKGFAVDGGDGWRCLVPGLTIDGGSDLDELTKLDIPPDSLVIGAEDADKSLHSAVYYLKNDTIFSLKVGRHSKPNRILGLSKLSKKRLSEFNFGLFKSEQPSSPYIAWLDSGKLSIAFPMCNKKSTVEKYLLTRESRPIPEGTLFQFADINGDLKPELIISELLAPLTKENSTLAPLWCIEVYSFDFSKGPSRRPVIELKSALLPKGSPVIEVDGKSYLLQTDTGLQLYNKDGLLLALRDQACQVRYAILEASPEYKLRPMASGSFRCSLDPASMTPILYIASKSLSIQINNFLYESQGGTFLGNLWTGKSSQTCLSAGSKIAFTFSGTHQLNDSSISPVMSGNNCKEGELPQHVAQGGKDLLERGVIVQNYKFDANKEDLFIDLGLNGTLERVEIHREKEGGHAVYVHRVFSPATQKGPSAEAIFEFTTPRISWKNPRYVDVNGDGYPDLLEIERLQQGSAFFKNLEKLRLFIFNTKTNSYPSRPSQTIRWEGGVNIPNSLCDVNGDGCLDILVWDLQTKAISIEKLLDMIITQRLTAKLRVMMFDPRQGEYHQSLEQTFKVGFMRQPFFSVESSEHGAILSLYGHESTRKSQFNPSKLRFEPID